MCITLKGIIIVSTENNVNGVLSDYHTAKIISSTKIQNPKKNNKKSTGQRKSGRKKIVSFECDHQRYHHHKYRHTIFSFIFCFKYESTFL